MNGFLAVVALLGGVAAGGGLLASLLAMTFDWRRVDDASIKVMVVGFVVFVVGLVGYLVTEPASPLSRGVVSDKRERSYTLMVMVGKVPVMQHHVAYELISTEGAVCSLTRESYGQYRVGDAVVCGWQP